MATLALLTTAEVCEPAYTKAPLTPLKAAVEDTQLLGRWNAFDAETGELEATLHVLGGETAVLSLVLVGTTRHGDAPELFLFEGFPSRVAGRTFLNLRHTDYDAKGFTDPSVRAEGHFFPLRYEVKGDQLRFWQLEGDQVAAAIRTKQLRGKQDLKNKQVLITASPEQLQKWLLAHGDEVLRPTHLRFRRLKSGGSGKKVEAH